MSETITITSQPIALCQLLKIANFVSGGGEAKIVISEGYVFVNGEVEYQKRKKIVDKDVIEFNGEQVTIHYEPKETGNTVNQIKKAKKTEKVKKKAPAAAKVETPIVEVSGRKRRPISF